MFEYNDPDDYFDVSNHEVDRQDDLEYEVRTPQLYYHKPNVIKEKENLLFGNDWLSSP